MKNIRLIALIVILAACSSGCGFSYKSQDPPYVSKTAFSQYIIVGDSIMDGSSDGELTTTASLILLEENKSVVNISLSGQTMMGWGGKGGAEKDGVGGAINYLTAHGRQIGTAVVIELGHNDWYISSSADDFFHSYIRFLKSIDNPDKRVSLFCVVPVAAKWDYEGRTNANGMTYEELRAAVRKVAGTGLCHLVETSGWFTKEDVYNPLIMPDGLHLAAGGHRIYKDRLILELSKY